LIPGRERSASYAAAHLVHDLPINGHAAVQVEEKAEAGAMAHDEFSVLED
jgi:hypothetical protein